MNTSPPASARHGLGAWLAFAFSALSVLLAVALSVVGQRTGSDQLRWGIGSHLADLARQSTNRLDRATYERFREVQLMAWRIGMLPEGADAQPELDALQASYRYYAWIGLTDLQGRVRSASGGLLEGVDVGQRPWFRQALAGQHLGDVHEAVLLAQALGQASGETPRFFDVAFPVRDAQGQVRGVLGAHVSWNWAKDARMAIFDTEGNADASDAEMLILATNGTVLLGPPGLEGRRLALPSVERVLRGEAGHGVETWPDGKRYLVGHARSRGYETSPGLGWSVLVRQPLQEAYRPVAQLQQRLLLWGLGFAALFTLIGLGIARAITGPLLGLARDAQRLEQGEAVQLRRRAPYREVETLSGALASLLDKLRELNAGLERRVQSRTAELTRAYETVRANEQRVQVIIESAQDPFVAADLQGRIVDWNSRAEALFGWSREEVIGLPLAQTLMPTRYAGALESAFRGFAETGDSSAIDRPLERTLVDRQGREIPMEVRIGLVDTGSQRFFSAFLHDISGRKEVERLKNEFISTVSHELRTPLTAIYGSLGVLQSGLAGDLPTDARALVDISTQSCERLIRLINDVLDVEKIASGQMRYERTPCALATLAMQAIRDVQAYADGYGTRIVLEQAQEAVVLGDADRLTQVLVNLLSNAAKFSPRGGTVTVSVMAQAGTGSARVSVVDHGPGIPAEFHDRVFERFAQADGSDRRQKGGTGLGLNICRSIVEAHGGHIAFSSEPGVHTEFFFELPLAAP